MASCWAGLYGLMALGLALVWGVLNIVNLAHGAFIMLGGYCWHLYTYLGIDPFAGPAGTAIMHVRVRLRVAARPAQSLVRSPMFNTLLITFGLDVVLTYLAQLAFTADFRTINPPYAGTNCARTAVTIPLARLIAFGVAVVLTVGVWVFLLRTRLGRAIRATAQNLVAARLYGVDPRHLYAVTFGIGAALAGAAGALRHCRADHALYRRDPDREIASPSRSSAGSIIRSASGRRLVLRHRRSR